MDLTSKEKFDFNDLFTLELANNHQGSLSHGLAIIRRHAEMIKKHGVRGAIKFQFRDLPTFIHPQSINDNSNKHIPRFLSTSLSREDFKTLTEAARKEGLVTMATPFDEVSVDLIEELGIDVVKIASCSAKDWPLLERAVKSGKPLIVSTGGLTFKDIDNLVSFFDNRYAQFALMHCVAIYPTSHEKLNLGRIDQMKNRYPGVTIGFSTHEEPNNLEAVQMAYAKGARIFERHIGLPTDKIKLNAYSSTPEQIDSWIASYIRAVASQSFTDQSDPQEEKDLKSLMRGVFLKREVKAGETLNREDVFFAFPIRDGQLSSGQFKSGETVADQDYEPGVPLRSKVSDQKPTKRQIIYETIHTVKGMLNEARIPISHEYGVELSHHYGIESFNSTGVVIVDCVNREYCKKILVQLPGQEHPYHHHLKKEETFHVLSGILELELEGKRKTLYPGDTQLISRGVKHRFWGLSLKRYQLLISMMIPCMKIRRSLPFRERRERPN